MLDLYKNRQILNSNINDEFAGVACARRSSVKLVRNQRVRCAGGSGSVFLGLLHGTTDVAIKVICSPSPAQHQSFIKEIMILKACRHPNIVSFLGASIQAQQSLLVMEVMPGGDLFTRIQNDDIGLYSWYQRYLLNTRIYRTGLRLPAGRFFQKNN